MFRAFGALSAATLTVIFNLSVAIPLNAQACRVASMSREQIVRDSGAIFVGTILEVRDEKPTGRSSKASIISVRLRVEDAIKGAYANVLEVHSDSSSCGWGKAATVGQRWLFFASGKPLVTSAALKNELLTSAKEEMRAVSSIRAILSGTIETASR